MVEIGSCIKLGGREYLCFDQVELDGVRYLYLITTETPTVMVFAETATVDGETQARIVGDQAIKQKLFGMIQEKISAYMEQAKAANLEQAS